MNNLPTYEEFLNESNAVNEAKFGTIYDLEKGTDTDVWEDEMESEMDAIAKALGGNYKNVFVVSSEDEDTASSKKYDEIDSEFNGSKEIGDDSMMDPKLKVVKYEDPFGGFTAYYFKK